MLPVKERKLEPKIQKRYQRITRASEVTPGSSESISTDSCDDDLVFVPFDHNDSDLQDVVALNDTLLNDTTSESVVTVDDSDVINPPPHVADDEQSNPSVQEDALHVDSLQKESEEEPLSVVLGSGSSDH